MIEVRPEHAADHAKVRHIVAAAFGRVDEADIVATIRGTSDEVLSLVATVGDEVGAHVLFSTVDPDDPALRACALGPVAVQPAQQGVGVGAQLIRCGIEQIREQGWPVLFVLGNPKYYYGRFGFELAAPHGWHYASHDFDRAFQVIHFADTPANTRERWVKYHAAFS